MGKKMKGMMLIFGGVGIWICIVEGIVRLSSQIIPADIFGEIDMRGSIYFLIASLSLVAYRIPKKTLPSVICWIIYPTTMVVNGIKLLKFKFKRDKKVMEIKDPRIQEILKLAWVVVLGIGLILLGIGCWWVYYLIGAHVIGPCFADGEVSAKAGWGVIIFLHVVAAYIFFTSGGGSASAGGIFVMGCMAWLIGPTVLMISGVVVWNDFIVGIIDKRKEERRKRNGQEV